MTKESDRFEELLNEIGYVNIIDFKEGSIQTIKIDLDKYRNNLKEMLDIYHNYKREVELSHERESILSARLKEAYDKIEKLEKENSHLHIKIDFLETELKDYKDTLKKNEDLKINLDQTKERTIEMFDANNLLLKNFNELQKENEKLTFQNGILQTVVKLHGSQIEWLITRNACRKKRTRKLRKENEALKADIILLKSNVQGVQIKNQKETIELLLKENEKLKEIIFQNELVESL